MKTETKCEMCQAEQADTNWLMFFMGLFIGVIVGGLIVAVVNWMMF
jgi:hypothetical protein